MQLRVGARLSTSKPGFPCACAHQLLVENDQHALRQWLSTLKATAGKPQILRAIWARPKEHCCTAAAEEPQSVLARTWRGVLLHGCWQRSCHAELV